jgi:hypothetical protein
MVCRRQQCGRAAVLAFGGGHADGPCPFRTMEARPPTATCGHPCRRGSSWPPRPRHHATTAIQTGSTAEHATTPEHPCPGVVARTGPQAVNLARSPGSRWRPVDTRVAAHPTTNLTGERHRRCRRYSPRWPPTRDGPHCGKRPRGAFFPGAAPEPGYRRRPQPGPWGRWPTRRCAAEQHLTTDLPENASHATSVTAAGELRGHKRPQGPPSRGRSSSTTSKSAWRPAAVTSAHRPCQLLHPPWQTNGGPRGLPHVTLDPPPVATRKHGDLIAPAPGQARGRRQARTGGSRGGHLREPPALADRLPDKALVQPKPLRQIAPAARA